MKNQEIANIFYEMADILEMQNVEWKPQAYRRAAKTLESLKENIEGIYKKGGVKALEEFSAIGEHLAKKIEEYIKTGKISSYEKLKKSIPSHIYLLMNIPGMGAKKVRKLNKLLKIKTIAQLKEAARLHKIAKIPGFGEKSEQDIIENIALMEESKGRIPLKQAQKIAAKIINQLKGMKEIKNIEAVGSLKRKKQMIRDIDIIVSTKHPEKVIDAFTKIKGIEKIIAKGKAKAVIIINKIQADMRVFPEKSYGAGLLYLTGSKNYNIELRKIAIKKGYKLNEYGLFDKKTNKMVAGKTEKEICKKLGVKYLKPEEREI